jgi:hypothetical protein
MKTYLRSFSVAVFCYTSADTFFPFFSLRRSGAVLIATMERWLCDSGRLSAELEDREGRQQLLEATTYGR